MLSKTTHITIIDGYNVIHKIDFLSDCLGKSLENARNHLIALCAHIRKNTGSFETMFLVFDGKENHTTYSPSCFDNSLKIFFSSKHKEADRLILDLLSECDRNQRVRVISDDNFVSNNARARGARVESPATFVAKAKRPRSASGKPRRFKKEIKKGLSYTEQRLITEEYKRYLWHE